VTEQRPYPWTDDASIVDDMTDLLAPRSLTLEQEVWEAARAEDGLRFSKALLRLIQREAQP
jgi:hypothetical protein